jgi:hypothetical protein
MRGRSENSLKNFFYSCLRRALRLVNGALLEAGEEAYPPSYITSLPLNRAYPDPQKEQTIRSLMLLGYFKSQNVDTTELIHDSLLALRFLEAARFRSKAEEEAEVDCDPLKNNSIREIKSINLDHDNLNDFN